MSYHVPVMLRECLEGLDVKSDGVYVDVTFGGGGHSRAILERLGEKGKLVAFDQDTDAAKNVWGDPRLIFIQQNFQHVKRYLKLNNLLPVDGILADLGVSSYQFDTAERGFSTRFNAALDMRMDQESKVTAATILNTYDAAELQRVFGEYGEVRNARTLANAIVGARTVVPMNTTADLLAIADPLSMGNVNRYMAQVFQALRIEVNNEMEVLEAFLQDAAACLKPGGRLVVMSYHSLEDRLVKNYIRAGNASGEPVRDLFGRSEIPFKAVNKKPIEADAAELKLNPRSRSARLRVAAKV
ncbi:16S rRNA (cytosine(1402)-N(4))-methyltransferase RsmH [soil metagenome]